MPLASPPSPCFPHTHGEKGDGKKGEFIRGRDGEREKITVRYGGREGGGEGREKHK